MRGFSVRSQVHGLAWICAGLAALGAGLALVVSIGMEESVFLLDISLVVVASATALLVVVIPVRTWIFRQQAQELRRQRAINAAAAAAAERFLLPDGLDEGVTDVLAQLGPAAGASRVYVYENDRDRRGRRVMSIVREWTAEGTLPAGAASDAVAYPYAQGFSRWEEELSNGRPVRSLRSKATGDELDDMERWGTLSAVAVPVFVGGAWWGYLGLDDCNTERLWSQEELDALTVAAATLGAAMSRDMATRDAVAAQERFRVLVEQAPAVVYIDGLDERASTYYMSPQIEAVVGYSADEWIGQRDLWSRLLHPDDRERVLAENVRHNETGEPFRSEYRLFTRGGEEVWIRDEAVVIRSPEGVPLYSQGMMQDVTQAKAAEAKIEFLAYHDNLTELPNQAMFVELAELALARANRNNLSFALMFLDVDGFKLVNDTLGMEGGDRLLREIAERLGTAIRDTDTLARRGGDEFLIMLADLERGQIGEMQTPLLFAESVAGRIQEVLAEPFRIDGTEIFVSSSVGISVHPDDGDDVQTLLVQAETAMLASKKAGPGGFAVSDAGVVDAATKLAFVTRLRKAVDRHEWALHYQPIVNLASGDIVGVEALVRWQTEDGELIQPNEFIPLAEELGLIEAIGDWVVEELVRQDKTWREEGLELEMGFNLSPRQFWQPDLAERILTRLEEFSMDPTKVMIEITESSAMRDPERAHAVLWDLHRRGLRVAIDDFGTGYSSMSRLRSLPIDVLKIDRSFVSAVDHDPQAATIVAAFIGLGQGLGMTTLAEGIETEEEWRFLAEQGCELGQGFYFSRPVPGEQLTSRYRAGEFSVERAS